MKKVIIIVSLLIFTFSLTSCENDFAFGVWDSLSEQESDITVPVGEGTTMYVALNEKTDGYLVPEGRAVFEKDVEEIVLDYSVSLSDDIEEALNFSVEIKNVLIDGDDKNTDLVNFDITSPEEIHNEEINIQVGVTLTEPETEQIYDEIEGANITFEILAKSLI